MVIQSIELKNFRNYEHQKVVFDDKINLFYGNNAQGKTNLLESVYVCGTTKSHKGAKDRELIRFDQEEAHLCMHVKKNDAVYKMDMHLKKNKPKGAAVNGVPIRKTSELLGIASMVFFSPEDLQMIKNGPVERRKFLNMELGQLDKVYLYEYTCYHKALMQRNMLLKEIPFREKLLDTLPVWDMQLMKYGASLIAGRKRFVEQLNFLVSDIHTELTGGKERLQVLYEPDVSQETFSERLAAARGKDLKLRTTTVGPHRDDLNFLVDGVDIRKFGSQGQQRTAALSVKLAEIALVKQVTGDTPILILDDVLSELDGGRQKFLLAHIHDIQTLISCTGLDEFSVHGFPVNKVFYVENGRVMEKRRTEA